MEKTRVQIISPISSVLIPTENNLKKIGAMSCDDLICKSFVDVINEDGELGITISLEPKIYNVDETDYMNIQFNLTKEDAIMFAKGILALTEET